MTIKFDEKNSCEVYKCNVCGHTYHYYYNYEKRIYNKEKPFIKMAESLLHVRSMDWEPDKIKTVTQYACPICGVLQIDVHKEY